METEFPFLTLEDHLPDKVASTLGAFHDVRAVLAALGRDFETGLREAFLEKRPPTWAHR